MPSFALTPLIFPSQPFESDPVVKLSDSKTLDPHLSNILNSKISFGKSV